MKGKWGYWQKYKVSIICYWKLCISFEKKSAFEMTKCIYVQFVLSAYEQLVIKQFNPG